MKIYDEFCVLIVLVLKEALQRIYGTLIAGEKTGLAHQELQKATVMVVLIFCRYGVNPYKSVHVVSSTWSIMLSVLNFPIPLRKSVGGTLLVGIVPGNRSKTIHHTWMF